MYGNHVHKAVVENKETSSGITIHYVDNQYDQGEIIFQKKTLLAPKDTPKDVAVKVQFLEHQWLPKIIEQILINPDST